MRGNIMHSRARRATTLFIVPSVGLLLFVAALLSNHPPRMASLSVQSGEPNVGNHTKWAVMFDDEFNGHMLDAKKWSTCYEWYDAANKGCTNDGNDEQEWYLPEQISLSNGYAILTAIKEPVAVVTNGVTKTYPYR